MRHVVVVVLEAAQALNGKTREIYFLCARVCCGLEDLFGEFDNLYSPPNRFPLLSR